MRVAKTLTVADLARITKVGRHACGGKLYMELTDKGNRHWFCRYTYAGKPTWLTLGKVNTALWAQSLLEARQRAQEALAALERGEDPQSLKRPSANLGPGNRVTFGASLEGYLNDHGARWSNERYAKQTEATLKAWTAPLARRDVASITAQDVADCLRPHWRRIPVKAVRMREQIAAVFDYADPEGIRGNPARPKVIARILPGVEREVEHHAAVPWQAVPSLLEKLAAIDSLDALALQFLALTVTRTSETVFARWDEIDLEAKLWTIPKSRMKKRRAHRIPLTPTAIEILRRCPRADGVARVFPSLGETDLLKLLTRKCGVTATVHGLRSGFADFCADNRICSPEVANVQLAHTLKDKTTRAYLRTDYLDERRQVLGRWDSYLRFG
jgi:integrase